MSQRGRRGRPAAGFTLLEAMIALSILATLVLIGVPAFNSIRLSATVSELSNELVASAQVARSEAIKRNSVVRMCASGDGATCATTGDWSPGWLVLNVNNQPLIHRSAVDTGYKVSASGGVRLLVFQPSGLGATTATFTICRQDPLGREQRRVVVGPTGGTRVTRTEASSC
ncbi:MAG: GspH/FimT family pseudopilin [Steroidobacteraceae bacterium]